MLIKSSSNFSAAPFIKEIGRGKHGARSLTCADAQLLYAAMLEGRVSDLEMGGILLAMRIKGESVEEIAGFLAAAEASLASLSAPNQRLYAPIVIPSYNGARKKPNLTPLLAFLLAQHGVPVLVHGVTQDVGRVTTAEIWQAMGYAVAQSCAEAEQYMAQGLPAFIPIEVLSPAMNRLLAMRRILGVRNSTHTLVKILSVFQSPVLRLTSFTHPEYQTMLDQYFTTVGSHHQGAIFLMRGTEGETVASTGRAQKIDCYMGGYCTTVVETQNQLLGELVDVPTSNDAITTARWINDVLAGAKPLPNNIAEQIRQCLRVSQQIKEDIVYESSASNI